jgi:hypothetical protein
MKITINKRTYIKETVDIDLPYYYKQNIFLDYSDTEVYGRIDEKEHISISITTDNTGEYTRIQWEKKDTDWNSLGCYLEQKYKSNKETFIKIKYLAVNIIV